MASRAPLTGRGSQPAHLYRAEAYRDTDRFRETVWGCTHDHRTVEGALRCGQDWMDTRADSA